MGISSDGMLVFGIELEEDVDLAEIFKCDDDEDFDFEEFVVSESGAPEWSENMTDDESSAYWDKQRELVKNYPVSLALYCSYEYPMYILSIPGYEYSASRGDAHEISFDNLNVPQEKIDAMKAWCLEHDFEWEEPKWLLCSVYG